MHEIFNNVVELPVESLRDDPKNKDVHADIDPHGRDAWLLDDIRLHGVLMPLLVKQDRTIRDGHRRKALAKIAGRTTVPCIVLKSTDDAAAFSSAQLARQMTVYAKCVLYRATLAELIKRGESSRDRNLKIGGVQPVGPGGGGVSADDSQLNQDWIKCEEVLGVSRRNLTAGVKLLDKIDGMQAGGKPDEIDRANRVLSIFRNRGLRPAADLLGEKVRLTSDAELDVRDWQADDDEPVTPSKRTREPVGVVKFAKKDDEPVAPWVAEVLKSLARVESLTKKNDAYGPVIKASLNAIEKELTGAQLKRAA